MEKGVARVGQDRAGGFIGTGAETVFVNDEPAAFVGSQIITNPNKGDIIITSPVTVFAENKPVAIQGAITAQGHAVQTASKNVFAGSK